MFRWSILAHLATYPLVAARPGRSVSRNVVNSVLPGPVSEAEKWLALLYVWALVPRLAYFVVKWAGKMSGLSSKVASMRLTY